jgi:CHAT domain-containing protein
MVLSACRTALGDEDAELGFAGFATQAGVKTALGSLWYVSDEGTLALMSNFYQELKISPIKAEALRQAQLAMIKGEISLPEGFNTTFNNDFSHPYYWSGFTMVGNPW